MRGVVLRPSGMMMMMMMRYDDDDALSGENAVVKDDLQLLASCKPGKVIFQPFGISLCRGEASGTRS